MTICPCGSGADFAHCCGPILAGAPAVTAEALMRSRYTAYVRRAFDHIEATNSRTSRTGFDRAEAEAMAPDIQWLGLDVLGVEDGGADHETGRVEFRARFSRLGQALLHHESAHFRREDGRWMYVDGTLNPKQPPRRVAHVGRNEPCPCGSGRKFKKCCGG